MRISRRFIRVLVTVALLAGIGYTGYVGYEGSRQLVDASGNNPDCRTPDIQFGWTYEAINYDIADDALLQSRNVDMTDCTYGGTKAGDEVVTDDGIHIAGCDVYTDDCRIHTDDCGVYTDTCGVYIGTCGKLFAGVFFCKLSCAKSLNGCDCRKNKGRTLFVKASARKFNADVCNIYKLKLKLKNPVALTG